MIGNGWYVYHLTDRCIELRKDDYSYRRFTGRDGYVRIRAEPGMNRHEMVDKAVEIAQQNDAALAVKVGARLAPNLKSLADYTGKQVRLAPVFGTSEDPKIVGRKSA